MSTGMLVAIATDRGKLFTLAPVALTLVVALAACGPASSDASGASPSSGTTTDPCQLLTLSEAEALTGATYTSPTAATDSDASTGATRSTCTYGASTLNVLMVDLFTGAGVGDAIKSQVFSQLQQEASGDGNTFTQTPVAGLGDEAIAVSASLSIDGQPIANDGGIFVEQGNDVLYIIDAAGGSAAAPAQEALVAAARTVLGRLPSS